MCTKNQLELILQAVSLVAKENLGKHLDKVILYGSYARGDHDNESDIDIMILALMTSQELKKYNSIFNVLSSDLGLEHDIVVSIMLKDSETFNKYADVLPFYKNILKEGIFVA